MKTYVTQHLHCIKCSQTSKDMGRIDACVHKLTLTIKCKEVVNTLVLIHVECRFLAIDKAAWLGLEETAGSSPAKHHVGAVSLR